MLYAKSVVVPFREEIDVAVSNTTILTTIVIISINYVRTSYDAYLHANE